MKPPVVICLGINRSEVQSGPALRYQDFPAGVARVRSDVERLNPECDVLSWTEAYPPDSPGEAAHFGFKPACFAAAKAQGYRQILWVDASVRIISDLTPIVRRIKTHGYVLFEEFHSVGEYCADHALAPLGITREESFELPSIWASVMGLNLDHGPADRFLKQWHQLARDGVFAGPKWSGVRGFPATASDDPRVKGHRHDQTAASVLALRLGLNRWFDRQTYNAFFFNRRESVRVYDE